ncbi:hypothetical protein TNCV_4850111 [Trichonephila clavipes]|nr:hypothetical protein TNCV_4850111 [Trichonephila clavipes]
MVWSPFQLLHRTLTTIVVCTILWRMLFQNQKRMVLLPEEVGKQGFLESRSPTFRIDSSGKDMRRTGFEGPDWEQKA